MADKKKAKRWQDDFKDDGLSEGLCCTMCGEVKETYSEIVYSQGSRVCLDCKKITQASDNAAFDRDMSFRR